ncbi:GIY-YIG nuclease family protein [Sphingomonas donggukensis]|uniref:GIY-YIG nuclease family protein n=1 Tax=Sphingomonas donggukensis TaxID=2949093 RepID=A0ABY4TU44_9SPHN|nr:GIY-YIG nuclease family protein [Sphingomonas donggukensis]URW75370.1 GIY-YIG nuclease family protein [Sphingomonas donggukensis]
MPAKAGISCGGAYHRPMRGGWLYIMTNRRGGVLYAGVTANLAARIDQHRSDRGSAFCRQYGLHRLVFAERFATIEEAIAREKQVKAWRRAWKIALIEQANPDCADLFERIV